ncbi:MAG: mechanosensitive ion channel family protein [Pseudomonadota bacterium]
MSVLRCALLALIALLAWPTTATADEPVDWTGAWEMRTRSLGALWFFRQAGDVVTITYPLLGDVETEAIVTGRLLIGTWADATGGGEFTLAMGADGASVTGRFDTGEWITGRRATAEDILAVTETPSAATPKDALFALLRAGNAARDSERDRLVPALTVLDFRRHGEALDAVQQLELAELLYSTLDLTTVDVRALRLPPDDGASFGQRFFQTGTDVTFDVEFVYGPRSKGDDGWKMVVPTKTELRLAQTELLEARGGELPAPDAHRALASPRDTLHAFLQTWNDANDRDLDLLLRTMNLTRLPASVRDEDGVLRAEYLKEVIDRVGFVVWQQIPDHPDQINAYVHFVHPAGRIAIAPFEQDDGSRIWQFTADTLDGVRDLFIALEDMPPDADALRTSTSKFFALRDRMRALDHRLLTLVGGMELWQWLALGIWLFVSVPLVWVLTALALKMLGHRAEDEDGLGFRGRFLWPLRLLLIAGLGLAALGVLGLPRAVDVPVRIAIGVVIGIAGGWLVYHLIDRISATFGERSLRFRYRDEMLRSLMTGIVKVVVIVGALLFLAEVLSIPYQGVVAGFGIGGLAVALAAQSTLQNFLGGLTLLADKPIEVGDFCRFGEKIGTVEEIGLRSVRVRSLDRTLIVIPNGDFVNLALENYSRRERILIRSTIGLRYETTPDQLRWVLTEVRKLLLQHPMITKDGARARLLGFGAYSIDFEIFAYVKSNQYETFLAVQEDVNLRLIDIVEASGTGFAFPSTVNYVARDSGIDDQRRATVERAVQEWRDQDTLPFPEFDADSRYGMLDQLEYPPTGSPEGRRARERRTPTPGSDPGTRS